MKGIQVCSNERPHLLPRGNTNKIGKIHGQFIENLLQIYWTNFIQTWHKVLKGFTYKAFNSIKGDNNFSSSAMLSYNQSFAIGEICLLNGNVS